MFKLKRIKSSFLLTAKRANKTIKTGTSQMFDERFAIRYNLRIFTLAEK